MLTWGWMREGGVNFFLKETLMTSAKGTFLSESFDVFVITSKTRTFFFPETEILNFGDF